MHSQRFILESMFYIQSAVRGPCFILTVTRVNGPKRCLFRRYARLRVLWPKLGRLLCFRTRLWIALALGEQLLSIFTSGTMKRRSLVHQSNPVGVEHFSHVNTFSLGLCYKFCAQKSRPAKWNCTVSPLPYSAESSVGFGRRERVQSAKLQLSVVRKVVHKTCLQGF